MQISVGLFGLVVLLTILIFALGLRSLYYVIPISVMDIVIVIFAFKLLKSRTPEEGRTNMRVMYPSASLCLLIFLIGRLFLS